MLLRRPHRILLKTLAAVLLAGAFIVSPTSAAQADFHFPPRDSGTFEDEFYPSRAVTCWGWIPENPRVVTDAQGVRITGGVSAGCSQRTGGIELYAYLYRVDVTPPTIVAYRAEFNTLSVYAPMTATCTPGRYQAFGSLTFLAPRGGYSPFDIQFGVASAAVEITC